MHAVRHHKLGQHAGPSWAGPVPLQAQARSCSQCRHRTVRTYGSTSSNKGTIVHAIQQQEADTSLRPTPITLIELDEVDEGGQPVFGQLDSQEWKLVPKVIDTEEILEDLDKVDVEARYDTRDDVVEVPNTRAIVDQDEIDIMGDGLPIINGVSDAMMQQLVCCGSAAAGFVVRMRAGVTANQHQQWVPLILEQQGVNGVVGNLLQVH